jgi:hypothetical protein
VGDIIINSPDASHAVTLNNPNTGSSYTLQFMDTLPGAQALVSLSAGGALSNAVIDTASLSLSGGNIAVRNVQYEIQFLANGLYRVGNGVDGARVLPYNYDIINVYASSDTAGSSGTTTIDVQTQTVPGGTWTSIFSTKPAFASTAAAGAYTQILPAPPVQTGVTAPVLSTTSLTAGARIRMNLDAAMTGGANLTVGIQLKVRI